MIVRFIASLQIWLAILLAAGLVLDETSFVAVADDDDDCLVVDDDADPLTDGFCGDQAIVRLDPGADIEAVNDDFDSETIADIAGQPAYLIGLPERSNEQAIVEQLRGDGRVAWAELNYVDQAPEGRPQRFFLRGDTVPKRGSLDQTYAPELLGVSPSGACGTGAGVRVAILDSGYDNSHPFFVDANVADAWNSFNNQDGAGNVDDIGNDEDDDGDGYIDEMTGHGTHVMGIVLQAAPDATIVPIRALDSDGMGQAFFLARAIYYAIDRDVAVINLSLGSTAETTLVREAVAAAIQAEIFVAAAAGNNGGSEPREYPATQQGVFGIAATNQGDRAAEFTSRHGSLALSAPGAEIVSPFALDQPPGRPLGSPYAIWSGTSMATPWVAGAAALLLEKHPAWNPRQVAARLQETAAPITGQASGMGAGRLDIGAALDCNASAEEPPKDKKDKKNKKGKKGKNKHKNRK